MVEKLRGPSIKELEAIQSELGESDGRFEANVSNLKNWLMYQPHLPKTIDEQLLGLFVRGCKHDLVRARRKLEVFCAARTAHPELFAPRDPRHRALRDAIAMCEVVPLPCLTPDGCRVTFHRLLPPNPDVVFNANDIARLMFIIGDLRLREESAIAGDIIVFDARHASAAQCAGMATAGPRRALAVAQDGYPQRVKQLHVLNAPPFVNGVVNLLKSMMKEKMRNRFVMHSSAESLQQHIPAHMLPKDYGGSEPDLSTLSKLWTDKIKSSQDYLNHMMTLKADLGKRTNTISSPALDNSNIFGYEGAFRQLTID